MAAAATEHGEIVEVISGDKGRGGADIEQLLYMAQAGALVVIGMGKAEVGTVADGEDFRAILQDFFHQLLRMGDAGG